METKDRKVGLAIFGLGRAGSIHFKNIIANYRTPLKWIVEDDLDKAHRAVKKYFLDETRVADSKDITPVLEDNSVDAVVVCTPTHTHEQIVRAALKAGKSVFCEKPIAGTIESTQSCYDDAEKFNKALYCAFNRRFDPAVRNVYQRVKADEIGQVQQIKTISRDAPLPPLSYLKISGGIFHDCIVHDLDMICWIVGETPSTVYAQAHCFNADIAAMDDVDTVAVVLKFPCGALGQIDISRHAVYGYDQRLEVFGSKGMLETSNTRPCEVSSHGNAGTKQDNIHASFEQRYDHSYKLELEHFLDVVTGVESRCEITRHDTMQASMLAEACEQSYRQGKPIKIVDGKMVYS
ncbi:myo-inositol 2-dehydrogenase-like [Ptychodera flava]|uniref:myo-inositol 2-dehydrogenase-like n=1 Tax=Ptychodera flava TaxID=63121 RepID=UPI003969DEC5